MNDYRLAILLLIPLVGAVVASLLPDARTTRRWALAASLATAAYAVYLAFVFFADAGRGPKFILSPTRGFAIADVGFTFGLSVDSIGLWLVLLTVLLTPLAIAASFGSIRERQKEYYAWMLGLLVAMLGVFVARDLLLFYVFFELTLVPMFFIIGIWGGPERRYAAGKFFLFTFAGSVFTLAAAIYLGLKYQSFDIDTVIRGAQAGLDNGAQALTDRERFWVLLGFLAGFSVKVPLFPVHTWLPLAHTEAPTAGSVILAGVLLKLGTFGLLRLAVPIGLVGFRDTHLFEAVIQTVAVLCVIGIIYGALVAWVQRDIKKLVAYSSVSHLGFCVLGLVALNDIGLQGSVLYMINHGLSTGALFLVIGMIYDRFHTRDINELSGLARRMPKMAFFFVLFTLSSIGLPGLNGFVSEFLTTLGAFTSPYLGFGFGAFAALGIILGAVYMLHMAARVIWGPLKVPDAHAHEPLPHGAAVYDVHSARPSAATSKHYHEDATGDLTGREIGILVPLALAVIALGVAPTPLLDSLLAPVQSILTPVNERPTAAVANAVFKGAASKSVSIAEVDGRAISLEKVLRAVEPQLRSDARQYDVERFRTVAAQGIQMQLQEFASDELETSQARRFLGERGAAEARKTAEAWRRARIAEAGGSLELARSRAAAQGLDFDDAVQNQFSLALRHRFYQRTVESDFDLRAVDLARHLVSPQTHQRMVDARWMEMRNAAQSEMVRNSTVAIHRDVLEQAVGQAVSNYGRWARE